MSHQSVAEDLAWALAGFKPVTPTTEPVLRTAGNEYYRHHPLPRFFFSPTYLAAQPSVYWWGAFNGCLIFLKRRVIIGNHVMYLVVPPVSVRGCVQTERQTIEWFRARGVGTMLSPGDRARYGYTEAEAKPDTRWPEYSYAAAVHALPVGGSHKNTRAALNLARRLGCVTEHTRIRAEYGVQLEGLARTWHAQKHLHRGEARLVHTFVDHSQHGPLRRHASVLWHHAAPIAHSLTEEVAPGQVVIVSRIRDYEDSLLPDPILTLHALDCAYWYGVNPDTLLTSGSAGTPGLTGHKAKLRPISVLPLGRLSTPDHRLTQDEYRAAQPGAVQLTLEEA